MFDLHLLIGVILASLSLVMMTFYATMSLLITTGFKRRKKLNTRALNVAKVVVLVPTREDHSIFNSYPYTRRMDYPDYTIAIVDDSSNPNFGAQLDKLKDSQTILLHREKHIGRKSGALNFALDAIEPLKPKYVVIFDADHRPTKGFLKKAVTAIETTNVKCVCGYQKHDIGNYNLFGRFYQACHAAGIVNFQGRNQLGIATIFGGGCGIFDYEWLKNKKFDITSITEDWELSLRGYLQEDFSIVIRDDLFAHCAIPRSYKWFITQQLRWSEGTTSDFRKYLKEIVTSKLPWKTKLGLIYQGLYYTLAWAVLISWLIMPLGAFILPLPLALALSAYYGASWAYAYARGAVLEGFSKSLVAKCLLLGFAIAYLMTPIYCYSTLRGAVFRRMGWIVTRRRG